MRRILLSLLCAISFLTLGAAATRPSPDFQSLYHDYELAVRHMDVNGYMGFFDESITVESAGGDTLSKPELMAAQHELPSLVQINAFRVEVESARRLDNGDFEVVARHEFDRDQDIAPGIKLNLRSSVTRCETWRDTGAGWRIVEIENMDESPTAVRVKAWL